MALTKAKQWFPKATTKRGARWFPFQKMKVGKPENLFVSLGIFPVMRVFLVSERVSKKDCATLHQPVRYGQPAKVPSQIAAVIFLDVKQIFLGYLPCIVAASEGVGFHGNDSSMNRMSADSQGWRTFFVIQKTRHWRNFLGSGKLGALEQRWTSLWECWEHTVHLILKLDSFSNRMPGKKKDQPLPIFLLTSH